MYGIDANALTREKRTGTERYVFELLTELKKCPLQKEERVVLYASAELPELDPLPQGWSVRVLRWPFPFKGWTHIRLSFELWRRTPNVFFTPAHEIPFHSGFGKIVSTVHDVAFRHFPELYSKRAARRQEWSLARAMKKAERLIAISAATKSDLTELCGADPNQVDVVPLGIRPELFSGDVEQPETPYFLFVGRLEKKKNIGMLILAFEQFKQKTESNAELILAGSFGYGGDEIKAQIKASPVADSIKTPGHVPDEEMISLLRGALTFVFPSKFEGFGMPALEAMAAGVPLIAADIPALREVAEGAGLFASPDAPQDWAGYMQKIFENHDLRERLVSAGQNRMRLFSWARTARLTLKTLRRL